MFTLENIGLSKEELQERVVAHIADLILSSESYDEDGDPVKQASQFKRQIVDLVKKRANEKIEAIAAEHILPNVSQFVENLCLQETNKWGEKTGKQMTFIEYLVQRAEVYMSEQVDYQGKAKGEGDSYNWKGAKTRITFLIHDHLEYSIKTAMKDALQVAMGSFAKGIHETARIKLNEIAAQMKVEVKA